MPETPWTPEREAAANEWAMSVGSSRSQRYLVDALAEIGRQREELRIAKSSWNCEEGQRIIAERDAALAEAESLKKRLWWADRTGICPQCGASWTVISEEPDAGSDDGPDSEERQQGWEGDETGQPIQGKETHCIACGAEWHKSAVIPGTQWHTCSRSPVAQVYRND